MLFVESYQPNALTAQLLQCPRFSSRSREMISSIWSILSPVAIAHLSRSLQTTRTHGFPIPDCLLSTQGVLGLCTCLVIPKTSTSWSATSKKRGSSPLIYDKSSARLLDHLMTPFTIIPGVAHRGLSPFLAVHIYAKFVTEIMIQSAFSSNLQSFHSYATR